jgi:hypothetical protein
MEQKGGRVAASHRAGPLQSDGAAGVDRSAIIPQGVFKFDWTDLALRGPSQPHQASRLDNRPQTALRDESLICSALRARESTSGQNDATSATQDLRGGGGVT